MNTSPYLAPFLSSITVSTYDEMGYTWTAMHLTLTLVRHGQSVDNTKSVCVSPLIWVFVWGFRENGLLI